MILFLVFRSLFPPSRFLVTFSLLFNLVGVLDNRQEVREE